MEETKVELNIPVFKKSVALALMKRGYKVIDQVVNYKKQNFTVFFFENKPEIHEAIKEISMEQGRKIFKLKNRAVANKLVEQGYELLNIRTNASEGISFVFRWTENIYETMQGIRKEIYGD